MKSIHINKLSIIAIVLVIIGLLYNFFINQLQICLLDKILLSFIFIIVSYVFIIRNCLINKEINNILFIIIILSIFFYFGQQIIAVIDSDYLIEEQEFSILDGRLSDESIINAMFLIMNSLLLMTSGFVSDTKDNVDFQKRDKRKAKGKTNLKKKLVALKIVAYVFILISIIPTIKYLLAQYRLTQEYGYLGRRNLESNENYYDILGISYLEIVLSAFFIPSVYSLLIATRSKIEKTFSYSLIILYILLYTYTGSRFNILKIVVSVFFIQTIWIKPLDKRDIKKYLIIGLCLIGLFTAGSLARNTGDRNALDVSLNELNISDTLWESGITFTTVSNILDNCPKNVDFFWGKSYLGGILQCLPEFLRFNFFEKYTIVTSSIFSHYYYNTRAFGYGSSFIAEMYFNFGVLIYPMMIMYGFVLRKIDYAIKYAKLNKSPYLFLILVYVCGELAYSVRNDLNSILRSTLFSIGIIILLSHLTYMLLMSKNKGK